MMSIYVTSVNKQKLNFQGTNMDKKHHRMKRWLSYLMGTKKSSPTVLLELSNFVETWIIISTRKDGVFWDVTLCGSCKNRRFGGTYRLLHQGDKNRGTRKNTSCN
jgi:hypothetical protein